MPITLANQSVQYNDGTLQTSSAFGGYGIARTSATSGVILQNTPTKVAINTLVAGDNITFSSTNNRFTATRAGVYIVSGILRFNPGPEEGIFQASVGLYRNGAEYARGDQMLGWNSNYVQACVVTTMELDVNNYVELYGGWAANGGLSRNPVFQYDSTLLASWLEIAYLRDSVTF